MTQTSTTITVDSLPIANSIDPVQDRVLIYTASATDIQGISRNTYLGLSSQPLGLTDSQSPQNKTFDNTNILTIKDSYLILQDDGDTTKRAKFQLSGLTTATTRTYTLPDVSDTLVTLAATQTLTNKTLTSPTITSPSITNATISADAVTGFTVSSNGTIYGISVTGGAIQSSTAFADSIILPKSLMTGAGSSWTWQSWIPTWTNVTIGNAVVTGKSIQIGKTIIARLNVVWGNTTSASGNISFSLPATAATYAGTANVGYIGYGTGYDVSASIVYDTNITLSSSTVAGVIAKAANGTWVTNSSVSNTSPTTWANTDEWNWTLIYEAA